MKFWVIHLIGTVALSAAILYSIHWVETTPISTIKFWDIIFLDILLMSIASLWLGAICVVGKILKKNVA